MSAGLASPAAGGAFGFTSAGFASAGFASAGFGSEV
jgi:hypothetical protein